MFLPSFIANIFSYINDCALSSIDLFTGEVYGTILSIMVSNYKLIHGALVEC